MPMGLYWHRVDNHVDSDRLKLWRFCDSLKLRLRLWWLGRLLRLLLPLLLCDWPMPIR